MTEKCKEAREDEKMDIFVAVLTIVYSKLKDLMILFVHLVQTSPVLGV